MMPCTGRGFGRVRSLLSRFFDGAYETYRRLRDEAPVYYSAQWDFWA